MFISKKIVRLAILSSLPLGLWHSGVGASTPVYNHVPSMLQKAQRSLARGQSDRVIQLLGGRVDDLRRPYFQSSGYGLLCRAHYQKQDYASAEKFCDKAVSIGAPGWSELNNRGVMRFKLERYDEALVDFKKAASIMMVSASTSQQRSVRRNIAAALSLQ